MLLPTDEQWLATIEGAPHLEHRFWMPAGATEGQARMRAWEIWAHARAACSTLERPVAAQGLTVKPLAVAMAVLPELEMAA
jgi:hypothetical protein